ncbi:SRPBCC domain-containing protein [Virgibacillus sp. C22-A2]|uniref:SRPBCC domain-containing protein n=1 Tax=Virgibacillus tibetensis TaxID=3042313 RepID=A0ABU6KM14_9BACI|nr:SRPBCC domain-containing protein [Virgibacillus sp. C22-A2]
MIVRDEVMIQAPTSKVWEVLVNPKYVSQWDELPEDYPEKNMTVGSEVVWDIPNGNYSKTTVIKADPTKELQIALYVSNWSVYPKPGDIAYSYKLSEQNGETKLSIKIGDFSLLSDGEKYYEASVEFASDAKEIIKQLAEQS